MKIPKLFQLLFFLLTTTFSYAQTITTVTNEKVGKLSSVIKKKDVLNITKLKISGTMNSEDFAYLGSMNNLEYLDIRDITLSSDKEKDHKAKFTEYNELTLPVLTHLKELWLPLLCNEFKPYNGNDLSIPTLEVLHIRQGCGILIYDQGKRTHLKKVDIIENDLTKLDLKHLENAPGNLKQRKISRYIGNSKTKNYYKRIRHNINDKTGHYLNIDPQIYVDSLYVPTIDCLTENCLPLEKISPNYIFINEDNLAILNTWDDKYNINDIANIDSITPFAFASSNITSIKIPEKIKYIPNYCFLNCNKLEKVILNKSIISIGENAFYKCAIKDIEIPQSVKELYFSAFESCPIERIVFLSSNPPYINDTRSLDNLGWNSTYKMIVPKDAFTAYHSQNLWSEMNIVQKDAQSSFNITVETPGSILSSLPLKNLSSVESLTITGFLYETDLDIIKKCKALKYLDLSHTYITYSPEFIKKQQADTEALNFLFGLLGKGLDNEYRDQKISTNEYQANKALTYILQSATEFKEPEKNCCIPYNAFEGMPLLETVKLPLRAACIYREAFKNCINLKTVEFPPYLKTIVFSAFEGCTSLKRVILPQSIETIGEMAFGQCISLEQIELPKNLKKLGDKTFINCIRLQNIIFPEGLVKIPHGCISGCFRMNKIVMPKSVTKIGSWNDRRQHNTYPVTADFYFKSSTPPTIKEGDFIRYGGKVHIPKGSITAYYNVMGDKVEYIEE